MSHTGEIILYQPDDSIRLEVMVEGETVWLTQAQMSILFGRDRTVIGRHIHNIFAEGELQEHEACAIFAHTTQHGAMKGKTQTADIQSYNLDVIISVGYRVKSVRGTAFRRWATKTLKEYILKGYAINQRFDRIDNFAVEIERRVTLTEHEIAKVINYIEAFLDNYDDINKDTQIQLELINHALAELQAQKQTPASPRRRIGYRMGDKDEFI